MSSAEHDGAAPAAHLAPIGEGWALWRDVTLRGAGLPAAWLRELGDTELARMCDAQLAREPRAQRPAGDLAAAIASVRQANAVALRALVSRPAVREALLWQNRRAVHRGIDWLLRQPEGAGNSLVRKNERLAASYLQRYCAKNDTIGFFGPCSTARLTDDGDALVMRAGPGLLASRVTYLEPWAIDALADRLSQDAELLPDLGPRRLPTVRLEGAILHHSVSRTTELPLEYARLLAACDGETPAREIAARLRADPELEVASDQEVYELLAELVEKRLIVWAIEVPTKGGPPEALLRSRLERLGDPARGRALAALDELEAARDVVSNAAGEPERVDRALEQLEATFVRLTGSDSEREEGRGRAYAGRTVTGEDCTRDLDVAIGPAVRERLGPVLALVLQSARWFTHAIAERYRGALHAAWREMRGAAGTVGYLELCERLPALFPGPDDPSSIVRQVVGELHERWLAVLEIGDSERAVERSVDALRPAVRRLFAAPRPGWPSARHHSPDVLIAARGPEAVNRGEFLLVLGELHTGMNTLLNPGLVFAHREPRRLFEQRDREVGRACVAPVWSRNRSRMDYYSQWPRDLDVENGDALSWRPRDHVLAAADLFIEERGDQLIVRSRDGRHEFDIIAFLEQHLIAESHSEFSLLAPRGHSPRVTVDGVVLARERWSLSPAEAAFARAADAGERFLGARAWVRRHRLPRAAFVKVPEEPKPTYVDFESPVLVEMAAHFIRGASAVSVSEMLPEIDELWLEDAEGTRYTSELRLCAVDPVAWSPP